MLTPTRTINLLALLILPLVIVTSRQTVAAPREQPNPERHYELYIPDSLDAETLAPLLVVLHPMASSGRAMQAMTGFDAMAEAHGMIVLYPDSRGFAWDDGRSTRPRLPDSTADHDVEFITSILEEVSEDFAVDADSIYLTGFAQGGVMAYRLACEVPERFAAVMVMDALLWDYQLDICPAPGAPLLILLVHGADDPFYAAEGRTIRDGAMPASQILSTRETLDFWANWNDCEAEPSYQENETVQLTTYDGCVADSSVALLSLEGVGHIWPRVGEYTLNQHGFDLTTFAMSYFMKAGWQAQALQTTVDRGVYGGTSRSYALYVPPSYDPAAPTPLVMALHGRPSNSYGIAYLMDFNAVANEEGFIVVYPDGIDQGWNYVEGFPSYDYSEVDDVGFLRVLISDLAVDLNIDQSRIYVTGFSNGGFMTQRLACDAPDTFAAFAIIGATLSPIFDEVCRDTPAVPILFMHGTDDQSVPWDGIIMDDTIVTLSVPDTVTFWVGHNDCSPNGVEAEDLPPGGDSPGTAVSVFRFGGCANDTRVDFYWIQGGGHNIPGVPGRLDAARFGAVNMDIYAPQVIWSFFEAFALDDTP
ncbi:MAG: hypothetical protein GYB66_07710 [Chloroflexi bacterium]|nr:hypothetical protein [Chloroflexota bacterium]